VTIDNEHERARASTRQRNSTDTERHKAALYVCHRANSVDDAKELLLALGLLPAGFKWKSAGPHGPRKKVTE
jgi:hypothetical protein